MTTPPPTPAMNRNALIAAGVVLLHLGALWALQTGLLRRALETVVPVQVLQVLSPPAEAPTPPAPRPPVARPTSPATRAVSVQPAAAPAPLPVATSDPAPAAPTGALQASPTPLPPVAAPVAASPAPAAPPAPARVVLPSSDADYLNNPRPPYPPLSKRLGEQGKVVVRVQIGTDGTALAAEIATSSGYDRLDQAALATVRRWRYVPGKRNGVPETMWFNVPIHFVLE